MSARIPCSLLHAIARNCSKLRVAKIFGAVEAPLTDEAVRALLQGCPQLQKTDVEYAQGISQELRVELAKCSTITELWLENWADMNRKLAKKVVTVCPALTELHCQGCGDWVSNGVIDTCAQHCPLLQILNLPTCLRVAGLKVANLFKQCPLLREVDLWECSSVGDEAVCELARNLTKVICPPTVTIKSLLALTQGCPSLTHLSLRACRICDDGAAVVAAHCPQLVHLNLAGTHISMKGLRTIAASCTKLRTVFLPVGFMNYTVAFPKLGGIRSPRGNAGYDYERSDMDLGDLDLDEIDEYCGDEYDTYFG